MRNRSTAVSTWLSRASRHRNLLWKTLQPGLETTLQFIFLTCSLFSRAFASRGSREPDGEFREVALWVWGLSLSLMLWQGCWYSHQGVGQFRMPCLWFAGPWKVTERPPRVGLCLHPFSFHLKSIRLYLLYLLGLREDFIWTNILSLIKVWTATG